MDESMLGALTQLAGVGLNHWGVVSATRYDETAREGCRTSDLFPAARSIVVVASGGTALWDAFVSDLRQNPEHLSEQQHPLDAFVMRAVAEASSAMKGMPHRWFLAAAEADVHLDFRTLAVRAGVGVPSKLGLVIDKQYGPWMGLRAACMVPVHLPETPPKSDLCEECASPCIPACPASALKDGRWSVDVCANFHRESIICQSSCASRSACPVGSEHRYSEAQARYHYNREMGRAELSQVLKIEDKKFKGIGPLWGDWPD